MGWRREPARWLRRWAGFGAIAGLTLGTSLTVMPAAAAEDGSAPLIGVLGDDVPEVFPPTPTSVVVPVGGVPSHGDPGTMELAGALTDIVSTADGGGYWMAFEDGGVFAYGTATFHGSLGAIALDAPVVSMSATASGNGYWFVASDGGVFAFGDAPFYGSAAALDLAAPIVGMLPTPSGRGYWLVGADGGVFAYGDAGFFGSLGGQGATVPIVGMAANAAGTGYWVVDRDGAVFPFGSARSFGQHPNRIDRVADIVGTATGNGYWILRRSGTVEAWGDARQTMLRWGVSDDPDARGFYAHTPDGAGRSAAALTIDPAGRGLWVAGTGDYRATDGTETGDHAFVRSIGGQAVRWNPCQPITWAYDPTGAPFDMRPLLRQSFAYLTEVTGLTFAESQAPAVIDGISVRWTSDLGGPGAKASWRFGTVGGVTRIVGGTLLLDTFLADDVDVFARNDLERNWDPGQWGITVLHETGHVLGLAHGRTGDELMAVVQTGQWRFGPGDLQGLRGIGRSAGDCT